MKFEPKKKMCVWRSKCGRCANCINDQHSQNWYNCTEEDRKFFADQAAKLDMEWDDVAPSRSEYIRM